MDKFGSVSFSFYLLQNIDSDGTQLSDDDMNALGKTLIASLEDESILDRIPNEILVRNANLLRKLYLMKASFIRKLTSRISAAVTERYAR